MVGPDFHRLGGDVDIRQLLELVVHAWKLFLDVLGSVSQLLLDPGDVEEHAAMRAAASCFYLSHDAAGDMITRQQFRRTPGTLVALRIAPALIFGVGRLAFVVIAGCRRT